MRPIVLVLIGLLVVTGCSTAESLPTNTPIPTDTPEPTSKPFVNALALELPGMEQVQVHNVQYSSFNGKLLSMDLYYPIDEGSESGYPVVVFVIGFRTSASDYRNHSAYQSWGRLVAADGMVGVAYDTERPEDLGALIAYLKENAEELEIDPERIGLWSSSSHVPTALWYAMQEEEKDAKFLVMYYGVMLSPDNYQRELHNTLCRSWGCYGDELNDVERIRTDLPLFIVRAGRDDPDLNDIIDHFMELVSGTDVQATYIDHEDGQHGFDVAMRDERSIEIIEMTLEFMKSVFGIE
ncbi:MAG: alpha/beta hydrolase [Anaerolineales bacterium]|nr:alpha/beta hydrolase [Anaerolineales bacterium]